MDIIKLKSFLVCCEEMNYSKASSRLFISRQALQQTIRSLEIELKTTLFNNLHNKLSLTASGEIVRKYAIELVNNYDSMLRDISALERNHLRIGISCSLLPFLAPELAVFLEEFGEDHPELSLELISLTSDEAIKEVQSGELTAALLLMMDCNLTGITGQSIFSFPLGVTFAKTHRFSQKNTLELKDLSGEKCVVWGSPETIMHPLYAALQEAGIQTTMEVVPSAKTAFYLMENENRVMLESTYPNTRLLQVELNKPLANNAFLWRLMLIHQEELNLLPINLLKEFLIAKYESTDHPRIPISIN